METDALTHAREQYREVLLELTVRERILTDVLVENIQKELPQYKAGLQSIQTLVKEIPEQLSLDHTGIKREAIKELEDMQRRMSTLKLKVEQLREKTP